MGLAQTYQMDPGHIDYTPSSAVGVGDVVVLGDLFCIADRPIPANVKNAVAIEGTFILPKASGAVTQGTTVYWDATNSVITTTSTGNKRAGFAAEAAASGDATVKVVINYAG
jgi:predicted RecA/RadA family phage recombinase